MDDGYKTPQAVIPHVLTTTGNTFIFWNMSVTFFKSRHFHIYSTLTSCCSIILISSGMAEMMTHCCSFGPELSLYVPLYSQVEQPDIHIVSLMHLYTMLLMPPHTQSTAS